MVKFLIDNNLPFRFSYWNSPEFEFVHKINPNMSDTEIWEYAKKENLIIVTKDADFTAKILLSTPPPKVIHFLIGNMSLKDFHQFIGKYWNEIVSLISSNKFVQVFNNRIEYLNE